MATDYKTLAALAPDGKLEMVLDEENDRDKHLAAIAGMMDEKMMALDLCSVLDISERDICDIQRRNRDYPRNMRIEFLKKWKSVAGETATYKNLVQALLLIAANSEARFVVQLLRDEYPSSAPQQVPTKTVTEKIASVPSVPASSTQLEYEPPQKIPRKLSPPSVTPGIPQEPPTLPLKPVPSHPAHSGNADSAVLTKFPSIESYEMNANPHGIALIINNFKFEGDVLISLEGYQRDEEYLKDALKYIRYEVRVHRNCSRKEVYQHVNAIAELDHSKYDSFICCILSHGGEGYVADCRGSRIYIDEISTPLKKTESLLGKPKVFFIQACRREMPAGHHDVSFRSFTRDFKVPPEADFVFGYATPPSSVAFVGEGGSHYVTELCKSLKAHACYAPLHAIMTAANKLVGEHIIEGVSKDYKQAPVFNSGARKDIFFL